MTNKEDYDYVVIGAGSAGCAVAARLTENSEISVLLLEAGGKDDNQNIHTPVAFPALFKTEFDWDYETTAQEHLDGRSMYVPRGKMLGGCSSINAMIYQRGAPACFDNWAVDNPGWSYADLLPLFKRSEHNVWGASEQHGGDGPQSISDLADPNVLTRAFVKAAIEQGYPERKDFNSGVQEGFGQYQVNQKGGMRNSTAVAYLRPAMDRPNLDVLPNAHVTGLIIQNGKCDGVRFKTDNADREVSASKEVVLCAGAIGSPQILMLSGVGPRAELEALGIDVVHDLPGVGRNLQEHLMLPVSHECTRPVSLAQAGAAEQAELLKQGKGLLTSNIGEAGGFLTVHEDAPAPDLQFVFTPCYFIHDGLANPAGDGFTILPVLVGTRSVGTLRLSSSDAAAKPMIDPAALSNEKDLDILVEGIKIARRIAKSAAFAEYRGEEYTPGEKVQSDEDIKAFIREYVQTIYHPVGTCKMGSDGMAVVDAELCVHGIKGLRVADASIMPRITNANTNQPAIIIGEKCADLIRSGFGRERS